jgi:hypothetical protein
MVNKLGMLPHGHVTVEVVPPAIKSIGATAAFPLALPCVKVPVVVASIPARPLSSGMVLVAELHEAAE